MRRGPNGPSSTASLPITDSRIRPISVSTDSDKWAPLSAGSDAGGRRLFPEVRDVVEAEQGLTAAGEHGDAGDRGVVDVEERERAAGRRLPAGLGEACAVGDAERAGR